MAFLVLYLGFSDGGTFPGATGTAAIVALLALSARILLARYPFAGLSRWNVLAGVALAVLAGWTLLSQRWSGAPLRAMTEFDRTLLYTAVFFLLVCTPRTIDGLRWLLRLTMLAAGAIVVAALATRLSPGTFPIAFDDFEGGRLAWPLTYFNTLGTMAGLACVLGVHHAADATGPRVDRVTGAALVPAAAVVLVMTFSRGALAATVLGVVVYIIVARPPAIVTALVAITPGVVWSVATALQADALASEGWRSATSDAERLSLVLALSVMLAGGLRLALTAFDSKLLRITLPRGVRIAVGAGAALAVFGVCAAVAANGAPTWVEDRVDTFRSPQNLGDEGRAERLTSVSNNGRLKMWRGALHSFEEEPIRGTGAGTFRVEWNQYRGNTPERSEAHSVYFETLGELGLVGGLLLAACLLSLGAGMLWRASAPFAPLAGAGAGLLTLWLFQAGVDWVWETPAVTVPVIAVGGAILAREALQLESQEAEPRGAHPALRVALVAALFALAVLPGRVALSQARTDEAYRLVSDGDCARGGPAAADALRLLDRPDARLLTAYCSAEAGNTRQALVELRLAAREDPRNWVYPYAVSIVEAGIGQDPRSSVAAARRLNPSDKLLDLTADALRDADRQRRQQIAERLPFPLDGK